MHRTRRILMVAFVATALSADRLAIAAPSLLRPPMATDAARELRELAGRLVLNLRRTVPSVRFPSLCRNEPAPAADRAFRPVAAPRIHGQQSSPFQFRLPPPMNA